MDNTGSWELLERHHARYAGDMGQREGPLSAGEAHGAAGQVMRNARLSAEAT